MFTALMIYANALQLLSYSKRLEATLKTYVLTIKMDGIKIDGKRNTGFWPEDLN